MFCLCRHKDDFDPEGRNQTMWAAKQKQGGFSRLCFVYADTRMISTPKGEIRLCGLQRRNKEALADYVLFMQTQG